MLEFRAQGFAGILSCEFRLSRALDPTLDLGTLPRVGRFAEQAILGKGFLQLVSHYKSAGTGQGKLGRIVRTAAKTWNSAEVGFIWRLMMIVMIFRIRSL